MGEESEKGELGSRSQTLRWEVPAFQAPASHVRVPKNRCLSASGTSQSHYLKPEDDRRDLMEDQGTLPAWKMTPVRGPLP